MRRGHAFCSESGNYPRTDLRAFQEEGPHRIELFENLKRIGDIGAEAWLEEVKRRYACPARGTLHSAHDLKCRTCSHDSSCDYVAAHREAIDEALSRR